MRDGRISMQFFDLIITQTGDRRWAVMTGYDRLWAVMTGELLFFSPEHQVEDLPRPRSHVVRRVVH